MLTTLSNGASSNDRAFNLRHVAVLTNKTTFLHPVSALVFGISAAGPSIIKLRRTTHDAMASIAKLSRAKGGIELRGMRRNGIVKRSEDHPIPDVASRTGDSFILIVGIIV